MKLIAGTALREVWPARLYCGPAALVAVTGLDYAAKIRPAINRLKKRRLDCGVMSIPPRLLMMALDTLGFWAEPVDFRSVADIAKSPMRMPRLVEVVTAPEMASMLLVVQVTGHYIAAHCGVVVDNNWRFGGAASLHPSACKFVLGCWHVQPKGFT